LGIAPLHANQQWRTVACADLCYNRLEGVSDGGGVKDAFLEAFAAHVQASWKTEIEKQLRACCALDAYAMVRLCSVFCGQRLEL